MKTALNAHKKIFVIVCSILILLACIAILTYSNALDTMSLIHSGMSSTLSTFENKYQREISIQEMYSVISEDIRKGNECIIDILFNEEADIQDSLDFLENDVNSFYLIDSAGKVFSSKNARSLDLSQQQLNQLFNNRELVVNSSGNELNYYCKEIPQGSLIICYEKNIKLGNNSRLTGISERFPYFIASSDGIIIDAYDTNLIGDYISRDFKPSSIGSDKNCKSKNSDFKYGFTEFNTGTVYCMTSELDGYVLGLYFSYEEIIKAIINEIVTPSVMLIGSFIVILIFFFALWNNFEEKNAKWIRIFNTKKYIEGTIIRYVLSFVVLVLIITLLFNTHVLKFSTYSVQNVLSTQNLDMLTENIQACEEDKIILEGLVEDYLLGIADKLSDLLCIHPGLNSHEQLNKIAGECLLKEISVYDKNGVLEASSDDYYGYELTQNQEDPMYSVRIVLNEDKDSCFVNYDENAGSYLISVKRKDAPGAICLKFENEYLSRILKYYSKDSAIRDTDFGNATMFYIKFEDDITTYIIRPYSTDVLKTESKIPEEIEENNYSGLATIDGSKSYVNTRKNDSLLIISAIDCTLLDFNLMLNLILLLSGFVLMMIVLFLGCICSFDAEETDKCQNEICIPEQDIAGRKETLFADSFFRNMLKYEFIVLIVSYVFMIFKETAGDQTVVGFIFGGKWDKGINLFSINASVIIAVVTVIVVYLLSKLISLVANCIGDKGTTISTIINSILKFLGLFFIIMHTLYQFGVNTTALLASAGLAGLVIGIAAKDICGDLIAGLFLIFEGNIKVGDYVRFDGFRGEVSEVGARVTVIKKHNKKLIVNNSDLKQFYRLSDEMSSVWIELEVGPDEDINRIDTLIAESSEWYQTRIPQITAGPFFSYIDSFSSSGITICMWASCSEEKTGSTRRKVLLATLELFRDKGIKLGKNTMKIELESDE
ncbi:MAG: mechanosensitive ion channel family protein [Lachnospiraceae bacterium]|nr:mechanosensitive ion channel family protein [Lachnospiraceae bacterium]